MDSTSNQLEIGVEDHIKVIFGIERLTNHQKNALISICSGHDTVVSLPTGSGKSLCFEAITTVLKSEDAIVIVVSPLSFLLKAEVDKLLHYGQPAVYIGDKTTYDVKDLETGKFRYILGNPEQLLSDPDICRILRTDNYRANVKTIVFDEVHTAVSWGLATSNKPAFRSYFSKVGDLRAIFPKASMLCLTATASKTTINKIKELFVLNSPKIIAKLPDRPNIRLGTYKVKAISCLHWLVKLLATPEKCPRTIIYCRRFRDCTEVYNLFCAEFGKNSSVLEERLFDMVHSKTPENIKNYISEGLLSYQGRLRIVIATKVLGMGLDIKCEQVVHYGPPCTMDDYLQQTGRAGRDGQQAHAILLYHGKQLRNTDATMLTFLKSSDSKCLRELALAEYNETDTESTGSEQLAKHLCCTFCALNCECGNCEQFQNAYDVYCAKSVDLEVNSAELADDIPFRSVTGEQRQDAVNELYCLKDKLDHDIISNAVGVFTEPSVVHGLTCDVIRSIMDELENIFSVDDIIALGIISKYDLACGIVSVLSEMFSDMDTDFDVDEDI